MDDFVAYLIAFLWLVGVPVARLVVRWLNKRKEQQAAIAEPSPPPAKQQPPRQSANRGPAARPNRPFGQPRGQSDGPPGWQDEGMRALDLLLIRAKDLADTARISRATNRFADPLDVYVRQRAEMLRSGLQRSSISYVQARTVIYEMRLVVDKIEHFIAQRSDPRMLARVGDADALAEACYNPIIEFANAQRLKLTSNIPVTDYGDYHLATWVGFIPTGLAPLMLPADFFRRIAWWPALAHEIAHDFIASAEGLDEGLREQLGIPNEVLGRLPLEVGVEGPTWDDLIRLSGAWFEEIFCDVFGTLMVGPAYAWAMVELFPSAGNPAAILRASVNPADGRIDAHPPRHLRLLVATYVLEMLGRDEDAKAVRDEWAELHRGWPEVILLPIHSRYYAIPIDAMAGIVLEIAHRLYNDQLTALGSFRLQDIPGVDFGPHASAESDRVAQEILAGKVPHATDVRWVISGATQAWHQEPDRQQEIIRLVRRAISAVGSFEHAQDAFSLGETDEARAAVSSTRDAFIMHTILAPPAALRARPGARSGFVARVGQQRIHALRTRFESP